MRMRQRLTSAITAGTMAVSACSPSTGSRAVPGQQEGGASTPSVQAPVANAAPSAFRKEATGTAGRVSVHVTWTIDDATSSVNQKIEINLDGSKIFDHVGDAKGSVANVTEHWYAPVSGVSRLSLTTDGKNVSGSVDGRQFEADSVAASPTTWRFADGGTVPHVTIPDGLAADGQRALEIVRQSIAATSPGTELDIGTVGLALTSPQDFGHASSPGTASKCQDCRLGCIVGGGVAGFGCGLITLGIGIAACLAAATVAEAACQTAACHGDCCPLQCSSSSCCNAGESCLNTGTGLCCSSGKLACEGKECCTSNEACITQGPNRGSCCNNANVCGPNCCDSTEVCQDFGTGQCCLPGAQCGTSCCARAGVFGAQVCADPSRSLCCDPGAIACNGACCGANQVCTNGACVLSTNIVCFDEKICVNAQGQLDPSVCAGNEECKGGCCVIIPK